MDTEILYKPKRKKSKFISILKKSRKSSRRRRSNKKSRRRRSRKHSRRRRSRKHSRKRSKKRSRKRSKKRSRKKRSNKKVTFNFSSDIPTKTKTLTIYGMDGCPACEISKQMCKQKNIKFNYYNIADHEDTVHKIAPGYKYVPVVVDENNNFIGGSIELKKYLENY